MSSPTRIDAYPTDNVAGYPVRMGFPVPLGATPVPGGVNFAIYSSAATACTLVFYRQGQERPEAELPVPPGYRIGHIFCITVFDLDTEELEYGFRMAGPWDPAAGHRFDSDIVLGDPYARMVRGREIWGTPVDRPYPLRSCMPAEDYDWADDAQLRLSPADLVIYEMHVRGFTADPSAMVKHGGTFRALRDKIPYLKELGVNCVELMPIFEFNELENDRHHPETGERLLNYWGYSPVNMFAPKAGYAASGCQGMQVDELKALIHELHRHGIEVILDVVFNHTAEGDHRGPTLSFRGLDNQVYYMLAEDGSYLNFSGCGNTFNCNHPVVREMVRDCLRYWVSEYHIDGFRFDLASILGRDQEGRPLPNPPLLEGLALDPVLADCKLIAEAWDAGGLYQVGSFPAYGRWAEWNGRFRDTARRFLKGEENQVADLIQRVMGSPDMYPHRGPAASINFVTCHDGFTLHDLYAYSRKHNDANGEYNRDGDNAPDAWNCGVEGETDDADVLTLRMRMMKNAMALLMLSHGVPMIQMGDEIARTQQGNNNAYCHDGPLTWLDWTRRESHAELFRFVQGMIALRRNTAVLRRSRPPATEGDPLGLGFPDISFHGVAPWQPDLAPHSRTLAWVMCGPGPELIYAAFNMYWEPLHFRPPDPPPGMAWHLVADTGHAAPNDLYDLDKAPPAPTDAPLAPRSARILAARPLP